jgi:argininosuccinate synthase
MFGGGHAALIGASGAGTADLIGAMPRGGAEAIASAGEVPDDEFLDRAAMESGTD